MNYIISTSGKSQEISEELLKLSTLGAYDGLMFPTITHPISGYTALCIGDLDTEILVHPLCDLTNLKTITSVYSDEQKLIFEAWIKTFSEGFLNEPEPVSGYPLESFPIRLLIEGYADVFEDQYMIDNGWIL